MSETPDVPYSEIAAETQRLLQDQPWLKEFSESMDKVLFVQALEPSAAAPLEEWERWHQDHKAAAALALDTVAIYKRAMRAACKTAGIDPEPMVAEMESALADVVEVLQEIVDS